MKKHLLIASAAVLGASSVALAQLPNPDVSHSTNLTLQWYAAPTGTCADANSARSGIGVNGKFYVVMQNKGVAVFNKDGQIEEIPNKTAWVSINCDDAGHVYFRNDKSGWAGPAGNGNFVPGNAQFSVIDTKSDVIIKADIAMEAKNQVRFDALPHIYGDMTKDFFELVTPVAGGGAVSGLDFYFYDLECTGSETVNFAQEIKEGGFVKPANEPTTLATAQCFAPDAEGNFKVAVLANNYNNPDIPEATTASVFGNGNNIAIYNYDEETDSHIFSGKWLNTPGHSAVGGFCMFAYNGKNYVCYPAGTTKENGVWKYPSGDGFFVMEEELVDTPKNMTPEEANSDWDEQLHKAVATKYATDGITTVLNYRGINVEPVEGKPGFFTIYHYNPGKSMEVWTLDLTGTTGIEDIVANESEAKIFGGIGVVVTESENPAQVYTLAGQLVAEGKGTIAVPAGVYVVKADNKAAKVIVK